MAQEEHVFVLLRIINYLSQGEGVGHKRGDLNFCGSVKGGLAVCAELLGRGQSLKF